MEQPQRVELVFVPSPGIGHVVSTVEVANILLRHDHRLSITVIIFKIPFDAEVTAYTDSLSAASRLNFVAIPLYLPDKEQNIGKGTAFFSLIEQKKHLVRDAVDEIVTKFGSAPDDSPRLGGFVIDMFCTSMIDVANQFGVPTYLFYTSGAAFLAFHFYLQELVDEKKVDMAVFKEADDLVIDMPMFRHGYPGKLLPTLVRTPEWLQIFVNLTRRFRETKGMVVNTFQELESYSIDFLISHPEIPPVYPVGPVLNVQGRGGDYKNVIMKWLEDQPPMSVVFLCFGSKGSFDVEQVKEIATALEGSGQRFLWSLRRPPPKGEFLPPTDYEKVEEILPEGFITRTAGIGKVIGWAPQVAVLSHPAVGGFVSHCGWNSTLESLWFGVPMAAWPMFAEQQFNAFEMVVELGLGVEMRLEYRKDHLTGESNGVVRAREIERAIEVLMEKESEVRKKVKEMSEGSRKALTEGGSSLTHLARFVGDVMANMPETRP